MFDRMARSFSLAKSSWNVLLHDKKLLVFPMVSGICCLLVLATFAAPFALQPNLLRFAGDADGGNIPIWVYPVVFAYYFCNYFVIVFCNSALISCALIRFNGGEPTVADGFRAAANRLPQIAAWAVVAATVGMILKAIERNGNIGKFVSAVLGTGWSIMTFFVVPVLVVEKVDPIMAVKRSVAILKKTWGEALIGNWGIGLFMFLLFLPVFALMAIGIFAMATVPLVGIVMFALSGLYFVLWLAVSSAMHGIYVTALYQYGSTGTTPMGFERDSLAGAFAPKKKGWIS